MWLWGATHRKHLQKFGPVILVAWMSFLMSSCSHWTTVAPASLSSEEVCRQWFSELDHAIVKEDYFDPALHRITGHPELRSNRFLAGIAKQLHTQEEWLAWIKAANQLAVSAYEDEFLRLPMGQQRRLLERSGDTEIRLPLQSCSAALSASVTTPLNDVSPADNYSTFERVTGLYPLYTHLITGSIRAYQRQMTQRLQRPEDNTKPYTLYTPASRNPLSAQEVSRILRAAYERSPLHMPEPDSSEQPRLLMTYAPMLHIGYESAADLIGAPRIDTQGRKELDPLQPTLYTYFSYTWYHRQILLQINYAFWFSSRPKVSSFDIYGGSWDGILWRVTLDREGVPILYDTIHQCGCYHELFLPPGSHVNLSHLRDEHPLVAHVDAWESKTPTSLFIDAQTHYVVGVKNGIPTQANGTSYQLLPYRSLLTLVYGDRKVSLFGKTGVMHESDRLERFLLWPSGISHPGAMREAGLHAIAFIGRRHFDQPDLLEIFDFETINTAQSPP